jgi:uncharacterized protein GlcG (DUF336 family)
VRSRDVGACFLLIAIEWTGPALAAAPCPTDYQHLLSALKSSVKPTGGPSNGGLDNNEWAAVVTRDGAVCAVAFSGASVGDQWLASRAIAAEKAFTANGMSLKGTAISTANLYAGSQPGGYLYGANTSNPTNSSVLYGGDPATYGTASDPLNGKVLGGVIVFGGGLALYDGNNIVGGLGLSGDTSCADHNIAWRVRHALGRDKVPAGPLHQKNDAIIYDIGPDGKSSSGFGHPICGGQEPSIAQEIGAGSGNGR